MNPYLSLILFSLAALCFLAFVVPQRTSKRNRRWPRLATASGRLLRRIEEALVCPARLWTRIKYRKLKIRYAVNIAEGVHADSVTRLTDAAISTRNLLYAVGSDADHIAVAGSSDVPIGTVDDEADGAEENVAVKLLGKGPSKQMVASAAIDAGDLVYVATGGKVASSGTNVVGVAITGAAADGDIVEVIDVPPGSTTSGIAASLFDANTILKADSDNTPAALTIAASRIVGRKASGNIAALTGAETRTVISGVDNITATPVAAAGSSHSDAGALAASAVVLITSDSAAKGVELPTGVAGMVIDVINTSSTACDLYPASGGTINGLSANAAVVVPASKGTRCFCTAADTWLAFDMPAKSTAA